MKQALVDRFVGLLCVLGGAFWAYTARTTISGNYEPPAGGPQMFPFLLGLLLIVLGILLTIIGFASQKSELPGSSEVVDKPDKEEIRIVISTFAVLIIYGFLLEKLGFLIATPVVILLTFLGVLKIYSWRLVLSMTVGLTVGCYVLFGMVVGTYLPRGTWLQ